MLFDLDGTLVDLKDVHWRALNAALVEAGYSPIPYDDHVARFDGLPTTVKLTMLRVPEWLQPEVNLMKQRETLRLIRETVTPDDRLIAELEKIGTEAFIGVVSNARIETCISVLMKSGIGPYAKLLIAGPHERGKPYPDPYIKAIEASHLDPAQTIAVEDNHYGVQAAEQAGLRCLRVAGPQDITYEFVMGGFM